MAPLPPLGSMVGVRAAMTPLSGGGRMGEGDEVPPGRRSAGAGMAA